MQAVIMAGGKGTRLSGLTRDEIPKPMVPILGKPLLLWQMDALKQHGITNILLVIGHLGHVIQNYFGNGRTFGLHIQYYHEEVPLGTAGALARIRPMLEETFFLIYGDVLFDIDLSRMERFHSQKQSAATLFVHPNSHPFDSDLVEMDAEQRVLRFDSKQNLRSGWYDNCVNAGLYLMDRGICDELPDQERIDLEADVLMPLCRRKGAIYAYPSPEYIKDIGTVERIRAAEADIKSGIAAARNLKRPQRAVFLDRDGTVNVKKGLISGTEQFELEKNAAEAIRKINQSGYLAIVVTNQPAVARGLCGVEEIEEIHRKMQTLLGREGVFLDAVRGSVYVGCTHERSLTADAYVGVNSQYGDALVDGGLERGGGSAGIVGSADNGVAAGSDLLLDHGDLALDVALGAGAHHGDLHAQVSGGGVAAGLHIAPVLGGQGLEDDGNLNVAAGGGGVALAGLVAAAVAGGSVAAAAGGQGQDHSKGQDQREYLFHSFFSPSYSDSKKCLSEPVFRR